MKKKSPHKALGASGEIRVADIMTTPVFSMSPTQSLPLAESLMKLERIRHIPVVEDGHLVGLVTHRDLLGASLSKLTPLSKDERTELELKVPVSHVMKREIWTIEPQALAVSAARVMRDHRFGCLPVVDEEARNDGSNRGPIRRLVGIVTEADLLDIVIDSLDLKIPQPAARPARVEDAMTPSPVTVEPNTTLIAARNTMSRFRVRHLPVVDQGKPIGLISDRELRVAEAVYPNHVSTHIIPAIPLVRFDADSPTQMTGVVHPSTPLADVFLEMVDKRLDAVLVLDEGRLVGILSALDACRLLGRQLRGEPMEEPK